MEIFPNDLEHFLSKIQKSVFAGKNLTIALKEDWNYQAIDIYPEKSTTLDKVWSSKFQNVYLVVARQHISAHFSSSWFRHTFKAEQNKNLEKLEPKKIRLLTATTKTQPLVEKLCKHKRIQLARRDHLLLPLFTSRISRTGLYFFIENNLEN